MTTFDKVVSCVADVYAWLAAHEMKPAGAMFITVNVIDVERELEIEVGVPTAAYPALETDSGLVAGVLPAGRYVTATYVGNDDIAANAAVLDWGAARGLAWDVSQTETGGPVGMPSGD